MEFIAFWIGIAGVCLSFLSYQQKRRRNIITINIVSRFLFVLQYALVGAFEGAMLDLVGAIAAVIAQQKSRPFVQRHLRLVMVAVYVMIFGSVLPLYQNFLSFFPAIGVALHITAFWLNDEKRIRQVSLLGCPFWFTYNLCSRAYGALVGDVTTISSLIIAMLRYDYKVFDTKEKSDVK